MRMQAVFNGTVIAESESTVVLEGNHYFPEESVRHEFIVPSGTHSVCPWKGRASYYSVVVDGAVAPDSAWYYPSPSPAAEEIGGRVAFWQGVRVVEAPAEAAR